MSVTIRDDRTEEEKKSFPWLVIGTDPFMSGWGGAKNKTSYAAWACSYETLQDVERWVRSRGDMQRVRVTKGNYRPRGNMDLHIYRCTPGIQFPITHMSLCPVCGERVHLTGATADSVRGNRRLIGSCGDAFPVSEWTAEEGE